MTQMQMSISRRAAAEGMVLLKNDGTLPLAPGSEVALFGAFTEYHPGGGGSSRVNSARTVGIAQGLEEAGFMIDPQSRETAVFVIARGASETADAPDGAFDLTAAELETLSGIKAAGFRRIVALCNCGNALNLAPLDRDAAVGAILWTWFPGGEGGAAVGDILSGKDSPSGRLASTFAERVSDYPSDAGFRASRWFVPYEDDIFVGYRHFETIPGAKGKVVYPFGHGLNYTRFRLEALECCQCENVANANVANGQLELKIETGNNCTMATIIAVRVRVTNVGKVAGRHSVLCYTSQGGGRAQHPALELRAFAKTRLIAPGESETLALSFPMSDLAYFDEEGASGHPGSWVIDCGRCRILVGGSVRETVEVGAFDIPEQTILSTPGLKLQADRLARRLRADGSFSAAPVAYPGNLATDGGAGFREEPLAKPEITLADVAAGKASLDAFLDQMTLGEALRLLAGRPGDPPYPHSTGAIGDFPKFGIPCVQTCDGPAGVRREGTATNFPCATLLASSFDRALVGEVGRAIGEEASAFGCHLLLAPGLCIHRHPLCGRNFEYFSEDPLVSGALAAAFVKGVQENGVGATVKHFAGNNREMARRIEKDVVSERAFREIYLRGFERAVREGRPWAVMTAYNGVNGFQCSENHGLVSGILREEWGFDGLVMTDWKTTVPMWREVEAGGDVKMPFEFEHTNMTVAAQGECIKEAECAFGWGYLSAAKVRQSAKRVCQLAMKSRGWPECERRGFP